MLNETQAKKVWQNMLAAETRAYYFGALASRYTKQKQWIIGLSFLLSSSAAASLIAKASYWLPTLCSVAVAAMTAYSIAVQLDSKIGTMAKLHSTWNRILAEYENLWNHAYAADTEEQLSRIIQMEQEPAELATTEAPDDEKLLEKWQNRVFILRGVMDSHALSA